MSTTKKKLLLNTVSIDLGCSSCRKPKLFSYIFNPKPKNKTPLHHYNYSSSYPKHKVLHHNSSTSSSTSSRYDDLGLGLGLNNLNPSSNSHSLQYLLDAEADAKSLKALRGFGRIDEEGVAVEKDSDDPYLDFRHSMLQMILENGIYTKDDMRELLNCFLQLNSPCYHGFIVRAFTDIWNGVFSVRSGSPMLHFGYKSWEY